MDNLRHTFIKTYGREPTEQEYVDLVDTAHRYGISDNDEFLLIHLDIKSNIEKGNLAQAKIVEKNTALIKNLGEQAVKFCKAKVEEFEAQIKAMNAETEAAHKEIQGGFVKDIADTLASGKKDLENCVKGFDQYVNASKAGHEKFLGNLDKRLETSLMAKVGDVINTASKCASKKVAWLYICSSIVIITSLFFGCFLYSANLAYKKGLEAGMNAKSGAVSISPVMELAGKYNPETARQILNCEWQGWEKVEMDGKLVCKPSIGESGLKGWSMPNN